jgi:hypothetical protein
MGSGKSLYGVRNIVGYLLAGRYVVTNVELYPDAFERIARRTVIGRPWSYRKAEKIAAKLRSYYVFETDLAKAVTYRLPGKGEGRGLFMWDETHNDLNNRNWRERMKSHETKRGTDALLEWATQLRKLGYVGFLLSQHHENTDVALRRVANYLVRLQNQKEHTRMLGMRVTPIPLFLASWFPANTPLMSSQKAVKTERFFLGWQRNLYDTHGLYHGLATVGDESNVELLPAGGRVAAPEALPRPKEPASDLFPSASSAPSWS